MSRRVGASAMVPATPKRIACAVLGVVMFLCLVPLESQANSWLWSRLRNLALDHEDLALDHRDLAADHQGLSEQIADIAPSGEGEAPAWTRRIDDVAERFIVLDEFDDEAVLDRETLLVWERQPSTTARPWQDASEFGGARFACAGNRVGARFGFRLATLFELQSLMALIERDPALPAGHPFLLPGPSDFYWTSTSVAHDPARAYGVRLGDAGVNLRDKTSSALSWCVRGPQTGSDSY